MHNTNKTFPLRIKFSYQNFENKMISLHDFWAFVNGQLFGKAANCIPGFINKNKDHVMSWDTAVLSTFKKKSAWQNALSGFLILYKAEMIREF